MVQYDTSALKIAIATGCPALAYCMCDAHVCGGVKGRASHDLKIGRVHRVGSMKGEKRGERGCLIYASRRCRGLGVDWLAGVERGGGRERERSRQGWRGEERERSKACLCVLQPLAILELRHRSRSTDCSRYSKLHSTRTHTTILFFDPCHDLSALCQSFQLAKEGRHSEKTARGTSRGVSDPYLTTLLAW